MIQLAVRKGRGLARNTVIKLSQTSANKQPIRHKQTHEQASKQNTYVALCFLCSWSRNVLLFRRCSARLAAARERFRAAVALQTLGSAAGLLHLRPCPKIMNEFHSRGMETPHPVFSETILSYSASISVKQNNKQMWPSNVFTF